MKTKNENERRLREALTKIAEVASAAASDMTYSGNENGNSNGNDSGDGHDSGDMTPGCTIKSLPSRLQGKASEVAIKINPLNATSLGGLIGIAAESLPEPAALTLLVSKYWGRAPRRLTVSFMENPPANLRARIISHMNAWNLRAGISFVQTTGVGQIRISLGPGGYWSYLGTDVLLIPKNKPTMNLQNFSMATPESEYKRVVRHETGHTLGFPHEHMRQELISRIDPQKAYAYFLSNYGWNKAMVDAQVLTPLSAGSFIGTPADQTSIMCYQLPGSITKNGQPILGGLDINATDYSFAATVYPKAANTTMATTVPEVMTQQDGWDESEDVQDEELQTALQETNGETDRSAESESAPVLAHV